MSNTFRRSVHGWVSIEGIVFFVVTMAAVGLITLAVGTLAYAAYDSITGETHTVIGTVTGRSYTPSQTSFGTGIGTDSKGNATAVSTTSTTPEAWILIMESDGRQYPAETIPTRWAELKDGDQCEVLVKVGGVSKKTLSVNVP